MRVRRYLDKNGNLICQGCGNLAGTMADNGRYVPFNGKPYCLSCGEPKQEAEYQRRLALYEADKQDALDRLWWIGAKPGSKVKSVSGGELAVSATYGTVMLAKDGMPYVREERRTTSFLFDRPREAKINRRRRLSVTRNRWMLCEDANR